MGGCCCSFLCVDKAGQEGSIPVSNSKLHTPSQNHYRCIVLHQPLSLALVFIISPLLSHNPLGDEPNDLTTTADTHILLHTHTHRYLHREAEDTENRKNGNYLIFVSLSLYVFVVTTFHRATAEKPKQDRWPLSSPSFPDVNLVSFYVSLGPNSFYLCKSPLGSEENLQNTPLVKNLDTPSHLMIFFSTFYKVDRY